MYVRMHVCLFVCLYVCTYLWVAVPEHPVYNETGFPAHDVRAHERELPHKSPEGGAALLSPCGDQST